MFGNFGSFRSKRETVPEFGKIDGLDADIRVDLIVKLDDLRAKFWGVSALLVPADHLLIHSVIREIIESNPDLSEKQVSDTVTQYLFNSTSVE
jgi:hypothetical protein